MRVVALALACTIYPVPEANRAGLRWVFTYREGESPSLSLRKSTLLLGTCSTEGRTDVETAGRSGQSGPSSNLLAPARKHFLRRDHNRARMPPVGTR